MFGYPLTEIDQTKRLSPVCCADMSVWSMGIHVGVSKSTGPSGPSSSGYAPAFIELPKQADNFLDALGIVLQVGLVEMANHELV